MSLPALVHVGFHKTGTTWLQKNIFVRENGFLPITSHNEVFEMLVKPNLTFKVATAKDILMARTSEARDGTVPLISSEILSGNPFFGGREKAIYAHRLSKCLESPKILITIRSQFSMMRSIYMQYISRAGTKRPENFFSESAEVGYFEFDSEHLEYDKFLQLYWDLFGPDRVLVLTQECLLHNQVEALSKLSKFCGINRRLIPKSDAPGLQDAPEYSTPFLIRINYFRTWPVNREPIFDLGPFARGFYRGTVSALRSKAARSVFKGTKPVSNIIASKFAGRYTDSNKRLAAMTQGQLDLSQYP